jgi:signal transduction histidine kinase
MGVAIFILIRAGRLLQATVTIGLSLGSYRLPWLGIGTGVVAIGWSAWMARSAWRRGGITPSLVFGDVLVGGLVLLGFQQAAYAGRTDLLTTSYNWTLPYVQSVAMAPAFVVPAREGSRGWRVRVAWQVATLALLVAVYETSIGMGGAGHDLVVGAGNAAGIVAFFLAALTVVMLARRFVRAIDRANLRTMMGDEDLSIRAVRAAEGRRLHDDAVQVLSLAARAARRSDEMRAAASGAAERLTAAIASARPEPVGELALALAEVAANFHRLGFEVIAELPARAPGLDSEHVDLLRGVATEALHNARKHSGADRAWVRAGTAGGWVEMTVRDEGAGFDPTQVRPGYGMDNSLAGRVGEAGGRIAVRSAPGSGTQVSVSLPGRTLREAPGAPIAARVRHAMVIGIIVIRAAYCVYAVGVVASNTSAYRPPELAVAILWTALAASAGLGFLIWRRDGVPLVIGLVDAAVGALVLVGLALALASADRAGSRNWANAYAVGSAIWLAFETGHWRARLAAASGLGLLYAAGALIGSPQSSAAVVATIVNSISPTIYFGIAMIVFVMIRRLAENADAAFELRRRREREATELATREQRFRPIYESVIVALEQVANPYVPDAVARARAQAEVRHLRIAVLGMHAPAGASSLRHRMAELARHRTALGCTVEVVDEELVDEPPRATSDAICAALDLVLPAGGCSPDRRTWLRARSDARWVEVSIRMPAEGSELTFERARNRLAAIGGVLECAPSLTGERRLILRVAT